MPCGGRGKRRAWRGSLIGEQTGTTGVKPPGEIDRIRVAEGISVTAPLDPYLSLKALASYSGLSVRKLREALTDSSHPLPCYRVGGKIVTRRSEFDAWMKRFRQVGQPELDTLVDEIVADVSGSTKKSRPSPSFS
jgi:hypothetical protein